MEDLTIERRDGFQVIVITQPSCIYSSSLRPIISALKLADREPGVSCSLFIAAPLAAAFDRQTMPSGSTGIRHDLFRAIVNAKKPLIAAIDGPVIGLAMALLCHFDVVYATPETVFRAPFADWGLPPEAAASLLLPEALGHRRAFELFCLGAKLTAGEAEQRGLITRVVDRQDLRAVAFAAASRLTRHPARALMTIRELLRPQRTKLIRRAQIETAVFEQLLGEASTTQRLKDLARAGKAASASVAPKEESIVS